MNGIDEFVETWLAYLGPNPYVRGFAGLVAFAILARLVDLAAAAVARRILRRLGSGGAREVVRDLRLPVFISVLLVGSMALATVEFPDSRAVGIGLAILQTVTALAWTRYAIRASRSVIGGLTTVDGGPGLVQQSTEPLIRNLTLVTFTLAAAYVVMLIWNVNVTGLVASAGIAGLALSFAAQDTLGNLVAGAAILTDKPYRIGDYIVLDSGERGEVTQIGLRSTRLLTRDDVEVSIPNGIMGKAKIVNESGGPYTKYRLRVPVGVAYGSDIDQVMAVLLEVAADHPQVCQVPEPRIRLRAFGESSLDFELLCWIEEPALRGIVLHDLNCSVYRAFQRAAITIPFPQRDVHIHRATA